MQQPGPFAPPVHQFYNSPWRMPNPGNMMQTGHPQQGVRPMGTPQLPPQMVAAQPNQQVARTAATPLQVPNACGAIQPTSQQHANAAQTMLANGALGVPNGQPGQLPLPMVLTPLGAQQFQRAYWDQWAPKHPPKDQSALRFEDRPIDLHQLHVEVMNAGSYRTVGLPPFERVRDADIAFTGGSEGSVAGHWRETWVRPLPG